MKFLGKLLVIAVFGFAVTALIYHFFPAITATAVRLPTYQQQLGWQVNAGMAISWAIVIFGVSSFAGYKLVKR